MLTLAETSTTTLREAENTSGHRFRARIIEGDIWGSSGYYSADVLRRDGPKAWPAGTRVFLDHPGRAEERDRPERSLRDLIGRIDSTPVYESDGLYADMLIYSQWAGVVAEMKNDIGVSIRAYAESKHGEAQGRRGDIITALTEGVSVDLVTAAGAGGKLVSLIESARAAAPVEEATVNEERDAIRAALGAAYGGDDIWLWVRDFDPDTGTAWYERETDGQSSIWQHNYTLDTDGVAALAGDPLQVEARTIYVPVDPAGQPNPHESQGGTMPDIAEAELAALRESAGRVQTLESDLAAARQAEEAATAAAAAAQHELAAAAAMTAAQTRARAAVVEANAALPTPAVDRIVEAVTVVVPLNDAGELDTATFDAAVETARKAEEAYLASLRPAAKGPMHLLGTATSESAAATTDALDRVAAEAFGPSPYSTRKG